MTSLSNKFTRSGNLHRGGEPPPRPQHLPYRVYGEQVAVGETFHIQGDAEIREEIQASLEFLAKQHLLEAEDKANKIIAKARIEAAEILKKANAQAKELLHQVQGQVDGIRENAHEEGFKAGFQEGYADATEHVERETEDMLKEANTLVESAYQAEKLVLKQFEKQAVELIRHLVRRIVQREMTDAPDVLMAMIQQAIESLYLSGKVQVVVSAQIIQDLRDYSTRTQESLDSMHRFEFIADPNLDVHQLYIIGQEGCFDLSPETQMKHLMAPLDDQLALPRPEETQTPPSEPKVENEPDEAVAITPLQEELESEIDKDALPLNEPSLESTSGLPPELPLDVSEAQPTDLQPEPELEPPQPPEPEAVPYAFPAFDDSVDDEPDASL